MSRRIRPPRWAGVLVVALAVLLLAELGVRQVHAELAPPPLWPNPFADLKSEQMDDLGQADTVLVGSSIVNAGLDPDRIAAAAGLDADHGIYNAALPQSPVEQWPLWYLDVVAPHLEPTCAVLGISVRDWNATNERQDLVDEFRASEGYQRTVGTAGWLSRVDELLSGQSLLLRYRSVLRQPGSALQWAQGEDVDGWPRRDVGDQGRYRNFDDVTYEATPDRIARLEKGAMADYEPGGRKARALAHLLDGLAVRGIRPVVARMPALQEVMVEQDLLTEDDVARTAEQLEQVAADHGAVTLADSGLDDRSELFADEYHLNEAGMQAVSEWVGRELADTPCGG